MLLSLGESTETLLLEIRQCSSAYFVQSKCQDVIHIVHKGWLTMFQWRGPCPRWAVRKMWVAV
jgi:hypothetical protein